MNSPSARKRILFISEAVTLAHVTRPLLLSQALDPKRFEIHFACGRFDEFIFSGACLSRWSIRSISPEQFLNALSRGSPIYDCKTLGEYVKADLDLLEKVNPDLVVGDFRLSLAISAPVMGVPYANITNAHWSPQSVGKFPIPEHPMVRILGVRISNLLFSWIRPAVFHYHARSVNQLRRKYGLAALGDLRHVYTYGDYTLFSDIPELVPLVELPFNCHYLGPISWSPRISFPSWWSEIPDEKESIYVTMGSSGAVKTIPNILEGLSSFGLNILMATAGRFDNVQSSAKLWIAPYLPGAEAARRSRFVVCNGGSATVYQALGTGVPVLGIVSNMDQFLTMEMVEKAGAGLLLRADAASKVSVMKAVQLLLTQSYYSENAQFLAGKISESDPYSTFNTLVDKWLGSRPTN